LLTIEYCVVGSGWAECNISFDKTSIKITASYLSDALGNLILGAIAILSGFSRISFGFDEEPGEYRWCIQLIDSGDISLKILSFDELWSNKPDSEGKEILHIESNPLEFGKAVQKAALAVLEKHGADGYLETWVEHPFPIKLYELLNEHIMYWEQNTSN